jgi:hypothetical protein
MVVYRVAPHKHGARGGTEAGSSDHAAAAAAALQPRAAARNLCGLVALGAAGRAAAVLDDARVGVWGLDGAGSALTAALERELSSKAAAQVNGVSLAPDASRVAVAARDRTVRVYSTADGARQARARAPACPRACCAAPASR